MSTLIQTLAEKAKNSMPQGILGVDKWIELYNQKFAELIVKECARLNLELSYELAGVIVDTEEGIGFDSVCLNTVKQVHNSLANRQLIEHFGVEL